MISLFTLGCTKENEETNRLPINLLFEDDPAFFAKTIILFEDDDYLIKTNFDEYIDTYPFKVKHGADDEPVPLTEAYGDIKIQVTQVSSEQDVLLMTDYLDRPNDSTYILAHHLEKGSCLIFDKKDGKIITSIEMEDYLDGRPMVSTVGRRFYINGMLFLETVDLIS